jgi:CRP/FNR family transcriptional regulator
MAFLPESYPSLHFLGTAMLNRICSMADIITVPPHVEILKEGEYVRVVPIVLEGLVKVFTRYEDKELLLYYIKPSESCVMSFSAGLQHGQSRVFAVTEEECTLLLLPAQNLSQWVAEFPILNHLFYNQFDQRYTDMLDTIQQLLYNKLDKRILDYLQEKVRLTGKNPLPMSHREIAADLGTAREVVSRLLKKFEKDNKILQHKNGVEILTIGD